MLKLIRQKRISVPSAMVTLITLLLQLTYQPSSFAMPGGPSQEEFSTLSASSADNMVDLYTGDFSYSIPLLEMEGYPITIGYNAGITMEQEASWVGLGWNLNLGSINRQLQGIPDDFNGTDTIIKEKNIKPNRTIGISFEPWPEFVGLYPKLKNMPEKMGLFYNSYQGIGFEAGKTMSVFKGNKPLDLSYNSQSGATYSFDKINFKGNKFLSQFAGGINSRNGMALQGLNLLQGKRQPKFRDIAGPTHVGIPTTSDAFFNSSISFKFKSGVEITPAIFASATYEGYYSEQKLRKPIVKHPAYGYMNLHAYNGDIGLADFSVSNDRPYQPKQPNLPPAELSYDNFSFSGSGVGGSFRLHRSDAGVVAPHALYSHSIGVNLGLEAGVGTGAEFGLNMGLHYSMSSSGRWKLGNSFLDEKMSFQSDSIASPLLESAYFQINGEPTQEREDLHGLLNDEKASYLPLKGYSYFTQAESMWKSTEGDSAITTGIRSSKRKYRNTHISYLDGEEASSTGLEKTIRNYAFQTTHSSGYALPFSEINRESDYRQGHHISSYTITQTEGSQYVYGIPTYNNFYKEASFNVEGNIITTNKLVSYSDEDASINNNKGKDNFYSSTTVPPYSTSHLLTAILSSDYVDFHDDGPTPDDAGSYVKYNYSLLYEEFGWRTPTKASGSQYAAYEPRMESLQNDDIGHYIYGRKEIWYPHSVETKNYIAIFKLTPRKDAFGVSDEAGGFDYSQPLMKLSSIELYTRHQFKKKDANAKPIKTIYFDYDYSLCPEVNNNNGVAEIVRGINRNANKGKLTLKRISIKNGTSNRGLQSPYEFEYSNTNPNYHRLAVDRWGYYKPVSYDPNNVEYPYVVQDKIKQDKYASAWNLNEIKLPSGGSIEVTYESDNYAYVQDQRAGRMFKIAGLGTTTDYNSSAKMTSKSGSPLHIYIQLDKKLRSDEDFKKSYVGEMEHLYFKSSVDVTSAGDYEYVSGYGTIIEAGICPNDSTYGWISLKNMQSGDYQNAGALSFNPISWFALQLTKTQLPDKVFPLNNIDFSGDKVDAAKALLGVVIDFTSLAIGIDATLKGLGYCKWMDKSKSWIRLLDPAQMRLGGGHRVKQIVFRDNWGEMTQSGNDAYYGKTYAYITNNDDGQNISSGVAAYEPSIGGDENVLHTPLFYKEKQSMFYKSVNYVETPLVESAYPAPTIGYSRVTIASLKRENVTKHATGKTIHQFHTCKDFPVTITQTKVDKKMFNPASMETLSLLIAADISMISVSQGYAILRNDMPGKPISTFNYSEMDPVSPVNGMTYSYYTVGDKVPTVTAQGVIEPSRLGRDIDMTIYSKKQNAQGGSYVLETQVDFNVAGIVPIVTPSGYFHIGAMMHQFSSVTATKSIMDYTQLKSITSWDKGGKATSEYMGFDQRTGTVITSGTLNEFGDWEYSSKTPAYWQFSPMGASSENQGARGAVSISSGNFTNLAGLGLRAGDKLRLTVPPSLSYSNTNESTIVWVTQLTSLSGTIKTKYGAVIPDGIYLFHVINSGNRNELVAVSSGTLSLRNPLNNGVYGVGDDIIDASATSFSDIINTSCKGSVDHYCADNGCMVRAQCTTAYGAINPYAWGERGRWRENERFVYRASREYESPNSRNSSNVRYDGIYAGFFRYWVKTNSGWTNSTDPNWIRTNAVTHTSYGHKEVENVNALNNYSSALLGYKQSKVVFAANNSRYIELFGDNFEDYEYINKEQLCLPRSRSYLFDYELADCPEGIGVSPDITIDPFGGDMPDLDTATSEHEAPPLYCRTTHIVNGGHTGLSSYQVNCNTGPSFRFPVAHPDSCSDHFALSPDKEYILSVWVKYPAVAPTLLSYDLNVQLDFGNGFSSSAKPEGFLIEGWQKLETKFKVPPNQTRLELSFSSTTTDSIYIDDLRIHPFSATVVADVFNPATLLMMAQLDENNYATFYEYDQELQLVRINKETEQGILTVKEFYTNIHKTPPKVKGPKAIKYK